MPSVARSKLLFDTRERGKMSLYLGAFSGVEESMAGKVVQAKLAMSDYLSVKLQASSPVLLKREMGMDTSAFSLKGNGDGQ